MKPGVRTAGIALLALTALPIAAQSPTGESMYKQSCAACHDGGVERAPRRDVLQVMSPGRVLAAMETGEMIYMAARWPTAGPRATGEFVTGKALGAIPTKAASPQATCAATSADFDSPLTGSVWNGWGVNT